MPYSLQFVQSHPGSFFGPGLTHTFVQALETGFIINQFFCFWSQSGHESGLVKCLVLFVSAVAVFQTCAAFWDVWQIYVLQFGNLFAPLVFAWPDKVQPTTNLLMAAPIQAFLIWRCWLLTRRNWWILFPLCSLLLGTIVTALMVTVNVFTVNFAAPLQSSAPPPKIPVDVSFVSSLVFSAVLDVLITGILLTFITRSRANVVSRRFQKIMNQLVVIIWEAAVPPCLCAIVAVVTYLWFADSSFWDLFFQAVLGKLYVISLFVTLNGRAYLRMKERGISPTTALGTRLNWPSIDTDEESMESPAEHRRSQTISAIQRIAATSVSHAPMFNLDLSGDKHHEYDPNSDEPSTPV